MFTNERLLVIVIITLIVGATIYFTVNKFKQDVIPSTTPSPSPTPTLNFVLINTPEPNQAGQQTQPFDNAQGKQTAPQPTPSELPLAKNKKLEHFPGILREDILKNKKAMIQTNKGIIQLQIYPEASMAASNFIILASNGFYDNLTFHRVESSFVIQGGDPLGNGTGGPGYVFPDEPITREYLKGTVAMANAGPDTNGSQFFILLADHKELPKQYTIFGQVIAGMDIVEKISVGDVMQKVTIQNLQ